MEWTWSWTPGFSAQFGDNPVFDWIRVVCVILGMLMLMAIGRVLIEAKRRNEPMPPTQFARFASLALGCLSISLTEIAVVGTPATPRLIVNIAALALGLYGVRGMRRKQKARPPKRRQKGKP
jgi:hypothetical protein